MENAIHPNTRYGKGSTRYHPAPPRQQRADGDAEHPPANRWKALVIRIKTKVNWWQAQIHRYYPTPMRRQMALIIQLTFSYIRLAAFAIGVSRASLFRKPALPSGLIQMFVHDRRNAVFRRRAVSGTWRHHQCRKAIPKNG